MRDLVAFVTRMLDADEAAARAVPLGSTPVTVPLGPSGDATREHIARHDPSRVLAGVAAKRRVLELHTDIDRSTGFPNCAGCGEPILGKVTPPRCHTLLALASEWVGAEGWDEGWAL